MKSKSFDLKHKAAVKSDTKHDKTFDFVNYYKSADEPGSQLPEPRKSSDDFRKENNSSQIEKETSKRQLNKNKKKNKNETVDISHINIDGTSLDTSGAKGSPVRGARLTSTPYSTKKLLNQTPKVKSIMKNKSMDSDNVMDRSTIVINKPKKRNKSVSFMLDDTDEVATKKTKSDDSVKSGKKKDKQKETSKFEKQNNKKHKLHKAKKNQDEKENDNRGDNIMNTDTLETTEQVETSNKSKYDKPKIVVADTLESSEKETQGTNQDKKKKLKKQKKNKKNENSNVQENDSNINDDEPAVGIKKKKLKNKKRLKKVDNVADSTEIEGEPSAKTRRTDVKAEIVENLENLKIGDNAHTLTNLLDEMSVAGKLKRKKSKHSKGWKAKVASVASSNNALDSEKNDEVKEKWRKRKWNKDKKGGLDNDILTSVIVENLPLSTMLTYKKLLSEHFAKCGLIRGIGLAEMYPTEESKPVFTTTITFYSEDAATMALEEDNCVVSGSRLRVKRPLPPALTTLVARSYGPLTEQVLCSAFIGAGRIRSIRHVAKGKKSMSTAFVEFDGPEAVERAIKMVEDVKVGGKKIHAAKFEKRNKQKPDSKSKLENGHEGESEDSNE